MHATESACEQAARCYSYRESHTHVRSLRSHNESFQLRAAVCTLQRPMRRSHNVLESGWILFIHQPAAVLSLCIIGIAASRVMRFIETVAN
jgi:hypothetical protein